ncbi:hypothetical protein ACMC56_04345 [Campylobacterota bacterium DY0563]
MTGKQIGGIILIIAGLLVGFVGLINVLDLIGAQGNKMIEMGLQMSGTSMTSLWIKYGVITVVGVVLLIVGIVFARKSIPQKSE